jgi:polyisoprenyl-phosphate glycosyltransferase
MKLVSIVVPAFNEVGSLPHLYARLVALFERETAYRFELVFVDDGSHDGTLEALRELAARDARVQFLSLSRNFGHQAALSAGLDHATGDAIVFLDADLQHPPEVVSELLRRWESGDQVVNTVRADAPNLGFLKRATSAGFYRVINLLADIRVQPNGADFRLLDRRAADGLRSVQERARFIRGLVHWIGYRQSVVAYQPDARVAGATKYSTRKMLRLAFDGIFSFSRAPLHLATWMGLGASVAAVLYAIYALYLRLVLHTAIAGWTSLLLVVLLLGGVQLVTLGILGSYIARIYDEARQRPVYLVKETSPRSLPSEVQPGTAGSPLKPTA